jgi:hypothetical protein
VADAVAAARILAPALQAGGPVPVSVLRRVQLRRWWPTALIQGAQRLAHRQILKPVLTGGAGGGTSGLQHGGHAAIPLEQGHPAAMTAGAPDGDVSATPAPAGLTDPGVEAPSASLPIGLRLIRRFPVLQGIPARVIAIGPLPEHAPDWARRPASPAPAAPGPSELPTTR